jgi:hypothetical protein
MRSRLMAGAPAAVVLGKAFVLEYGSGVVPDLAPMLSAQVDCGQQY